MRRTLIKTVIIISIMTVLASFCFVEANTLFNGNFQTTKITIEGLEKSDGMCYGTLLSKMPASGSWDLRDVNSLNAPEKIVSAFKNYKDVDGYYFLGFLQDAGDGEIYWMTHPPENFKVLLYLEDTDTFLVTEPLSRYCLESPHKIVVSDGKIVSATRSYDYLKMILLILARSAIGLVISLTISFLYCKAQYLRRRYFVITNIILMLLIHSIIAIYSFKRGFTIVEYLGLMWLLYIAFTIIQGSIYSRKVADIKYPFYIAGVTNIAVFAVFLLLVDVTPQLFNV